MGPLKPAATVMKRLVEHSVETKCRRHERSEVEGTETPDDNRHKHSPRESRDSIFTRPVCLISTELRATPRPHAISAPWIGRQDL